VEWGRESDKMSQSWEVLEKMGDDLKVTVRSKGDAYLDL
jgi:hypothetical protein